MTFCHDPRSPLLWADFAACQNEDPGLFFPLTWEEHPGQSIEQARRVCRTCPVKAACLDWALRTGEPDGIWGGTTPAERRRLRAHRRQAAA
jgi:WhiB family transcriptional regulator, redox-sensing transcriptional regulator